MSSLLPTGMTSVPAGRRRAGDMDPGDNRPLRQQILFVYATSLAIGLHLGLIHLFLWRRPGAFFFFLAATVVFSTMTLVLWQWVLPRWSARRSLARIGWQMLISIATFTALSFLSTEVNAFLFDGHSLLRPYTGGDLSITIPSATLRHAPVIYSLIPIIPTAVLCVVGFNLHWWRILRLQGRQRELQELAASAQLAALRAQINPHFFFNSLNSIAQLISTEPSKAEVCVERLADIFRYILKRTHAEFVPLEDELQVAEAYLEIERARFGDDLKVSEEIDDGARRSLLPSFILQPLVENAVKHGISQKIGGGTVLIRARLAADELQLTVRDTGAGIRANGSLFDRGLGLRSVRDRLVKLYGIEFTPAIDTQPGEGTTVTLRIPVPLSTGGTPA